MGIFFWGGDFQGKRESWGGWGGGGGGGLPVTGAM